MTGVLSRLDSRGRGCGHLRGLAGLIPVALALGICAGLVGEAAGQTAAGPIAVVLKVKNEVSQRADASSPWAPAVKGEPLVPGHEIRTGTDGFCAVIFRDDRSLLKLNGSTDVQLRAQPGPGGTLAKSLWLSAGGIWAQISKQTGVGFQIETPTSVASVKGTTGFDAVDANGNTTLFGLQGIWEFSNRLGSVTVGAGYQGYSNGTETPKVTKTPPGGGPPRLGDDELLPGEKRVPGDGSSQELRIGVQAPDGTRHTLIIKYRKAQSEH